MTTETNCGIRPDPPRAPRPRTDREIADYVAGNWTECGHNLTGEDVLLIERELQQARAAEFGRSCLLSGRIPARGSRLS
jgi:hypothetical protein